MSLGIFSQPGTRQLTTVLLPATASMVGGVKIGANITVQADGTISVAAPGAPYVLPPATASALGGVKIGSGITVQGDGTISVTPGQNQVQTDWNAASGMAQILNRPNLTSGSSPVIWPALTIQEANGSGSSFAFSFDASHNALLGSSAAIWINTPVLEMQGKFNVLNGNGVFVNSADGSRYGQFQCLSNTGDPTLTSSTGVFNSCGIRNSTTYGFVAASPDQSRYAQLHCTSNTDDPYLESSTSNLKIACNLNQTAGSIYTANQISATSRINGAADIVIWSGSVGSGPYLQLQAGAGINGGATIGASSGWLQINASVYCSGNVYAGATNGSSGGAVYVYGADTSHYGTLSADNAKVYIAHTQSLIQVNGTLVASGGYVESSHGSYFIAMDGDVDGTNPGFNTNGPVYMFYGAPIQCQQIQLDGIKTHAGVGGGYGPNAHNFYWSGGVQCWVDTSNVGTIQMQSDYRLKENIEPLGRALEMVNRLRPVRFAWRDIEGDIWRSDGVEHFGLIAHEAQAVAPNLIQGEKDALTVDGKIQAQTVNMLDLLALLVGAVQELSRRIN